jgi:rare lipoprotein A
MRWRPLRWWCLPLLLLLLAGCSSNRTRPAHGSVAGARERASEAPGRGYSRRGSSGSRGVYDDISRSQGSRYSSSDDSVPDGPPPDLSKLVEPVPKNEPRSLYGNKSPYTVLGQSYTVLPSAHGYVDRGIASFYGNKFHGYKTSNLENYDMYAFSAAHKTLPIPSYARVTNLQNGRSVIVRINDRGPFHANRIIDLSYAAAVKIGVWPKGTGLVEVRAIDPDHPEDSPPPAAVVDGQVRTTPAETLPIRTEPTVMVTAPAPASTSPSNPAVRRELSAGAPVPVLGPKPSIYLQAGAFSDAGNADRLAQRLRAANLGEVQVVQVNVSGRSIRRVRIGPLPDVEKADEVSARIEDMGLPRPQVAVD